MRVFALVVKPYAHDEIQGILERQTLNMALCSRLQACALRVLFHKNSLDNDDVRGFTELLSTISSPILSTLTLSLLVHRTKDRPIVRRVTYSEMRAFDWAGIEATLARGSLPGLRNLVIEGEGEAAVLQDYIARVFPVLHARRVIQLLPSSTT